MGARVAEDGERVGIVPVTRGQDLDALPGLEREPQVLDAAVLTDQNRLLGEFRADRLRGVEPGRAVGEFERRIVGKENLHGGQG